MGRERFSVADLVSSETVISVGEKDLVVHAISLEQMITLFLAYQTDFLSLYGLAMQQLSDKKTDLSRSDMVYGSILLSAPKLVARIIVLGADLASDEVTTDQAVIEVRKRMPATTQAIALSEIMKLSVPDPKKAKELLSEVTALLQKHFPELLKSLTKNDGQTTSSQASNDSSQTATDSKTS